MVLYSYENKGYEKYRLKPSASACEECKESGRNTYAIEKLKAAEFLPLVHPNCRCTAQILDDKNKAVATVDSKAIEITVDNYFLINYRNFPKEIIANGKKIN